MPKSTKKTNCGFFLIRFTLSDNRNQKPITSNQSKTKISRQFLVSGIWLLVTCQVGCTAYRPFTSSSPLAPFLPEQYEHYYDYPAPDLSAKVVLEKQEQSYILRQVEFPLVLPPDLEVKNLQEYQKQTESLLQSDKKTAGDHQLRFTNRVDYYLPKNWRPGEKRPAILISPILGGNMVVDRFAAYYTGRGYIAAIVHRKRLQWEDGEEMEQIENYIRTSVIRLRQALDWLEKQPEVDANRIGAFGVSYGAILHTILAAVEPRIQYHVLAMPGAPLAEAIMTCPEKQIVKLRKKLQEVYGWEGEEMRRSLKKMIQSDPEYLAPYVPKQKVQMYIALFDRVVGTGRSFHLWKKLGKPELKLIPFGHYGGVVVFPLLQTQSYRAFKKHLKKVDKGIGE